MNFGCNHLCSTMFASKLFLICLVWLYMGGCLGVVCAVRACLLRSGILAKSLQAQHWWGCALANSENIGMCLYNIWFCRRSHMGALGRQKIAGCYDGKSSPCASNVPKRHHGCRRRSGIYPWASCWGWDLFQASCCRFGFGHTFFHFCGHK